MDLKDLNTAAGISPFEIMKEHKENWSQLESLSQMIEVYFGDRVGIEAHALLHALSDEPVNELSVSEFVRKFQGLKDSGKLDFDHIVAIANDPDLIPTRSKLVSAALNQLGLDMKASIRNDIAASASIRIQ